MASIELILGTTHVTPTGGTPWQRKRHQLAPDDGEFDGGSSNGDELDCVEVGVYYEETVQQNWPSS